MLSLWALASSPFILGTDLTHLCRQDLKLLMNRSVLSVDQNGMDASQISSNATSVVEAKTEPDGDGIAGLFNKSTRPEVVSTTASAIGLPADSRGYLLKDLWSNRARLTTGKISATVPPHGVALYRVIPLPTRPG